VTRALARSTVPVLGAFATRANAPRTADVALVRIGTAIFVMLLYLVYSLYFFVMKRRSLRSIELYRKL
jgi:hypothetical protein